MELSYFLARKEGLISTPEKPITKNAQKLFNCYWKRAISKALDGTKNLSLEGIIVFKFLIKSILDISKTTSICAEDIYATLENVIKKKESGGFEVNREIIESWKKSSSTKRLDEKKINWTPSIYWKSTAIPLSSQIVFK